MTSPSEKPRRLLLLDAETGLPRHLRMEHAEIPDERVFRVSQRLRVLHLSEGIPEETAEEIAGQVTAKDPSVLVLFGMSGAVKLNVYEESYCFTGAVPEVVLRYLRTKRPREELSAMELIGGFARQTAPEHWATVASLDVLRVLYTLCGRRSKPRPPEFLRAVDMDRGEIFIRLAAGDISWDEDGRIWAPTAQFAREVAGMKDPREYSLGGSGAVDPS